MQERESMASQLGHSVQLPIMCHFRRYFITLSEQPRYLLTECVTGT